MYAWGKKNLKYLLPILFAVILFGVPVASIVFDGPTLHLNTLTAHASHTCPPGQIAVHNPDLGPTCTGQSSNGTITQNTPGGDETSDLSLWDIFNSFESVVAYLGNMILSFFGIILAIAGMLLNVVVWVTIEQMSMFVNNVTGIRLAWELIRDIINIVFIFVLLFIGINTILSSVTSGSTFNTKLIPRVLIAALLINFSMLFTKLVIDASNIVTVELYNAAASIDQETSVGVDLSVTGLSGAIMQGAMITPLVYDPNLTVAAEGNADPSSHIITKTIMGSILILMAAFVFFTMAFMLLSRFIVFILLIVTSPVAFIGKLLPQLEPQSKKWWNALSSQAMFAPIFFALILVVIVIINEPGFENAMAAIRTSAQGAAAGAKSSGIGYWAGVVGTLIQYFIVLFLTSAALVIAKSTSGDLGGKFVAWGEKLGRSVTLGVGSKVAGYGARATVGLGAEKIGKRYDQFISTRKEALDEAKAAAAASGGTVSRFQRAQGAFIGGFADRGIRGGLKATEQARYFGQESREQVEKAERERNRDLNQETADRIREETIAAGRKIANAQFESGKFDSATEEVEKFIKEVGKVTNDKITDMLQHDLDTLKDKRFAMALTSKQIEHIEKSTDVSQADIAAIKKAREDGLKFRYEKAADKKKEAQRLAAGKPADVAALPAEVLTLKDVAQSLSIATLSQITRDGKMSDENRSAIRNHILGGALNSAEQAHQKVLLGLIKSGTPLDSNQKAKFDDYERRTKAIEWLNDPRNLAF